MRSPESLARFRRIVKPWRLAFVGYAVALTAGTHWPRLELPPEVPATDKTIHLLAFGGLTILLRQTRWVRSWWLVGLIVLIWAAIDESTQGIPGINRTVSIYDYVANVMGVVVALAWCWALQPRGVQGGANQSRMALFHYVVEEMFADRRAWLAGVLGAAVGGLPLLAFWLLVRPGPEPMRTAVGLAAFAAAIVTYLIWMRVWKRHWQPVVRERPCLDCGMPLGFAAFVQGRDPVCPRCGSVQSARVWANVPGPSRKMILHIASRPVFIGIAVLALGFAAIFLFPLVYAYLINSASSSARVMPRIVHWAAALPAELTGAVDLATCLLLFAVVIGLYRSGLARFYDQGSRCMRCGHDLRGTPTVNGIGRCGECGTPFTREISDEKK